MKNIENKSIDNEMSKVVKQSGTIPYLYIENQHMVAFDVDNTLVLWGDNPYSPGPEKIEFNNYGQRVYLTPHAEHIFLLKTYKPRGFGVLVWSAAGAEWAKEVIDKLGLSENIDLILSKTCKFFDDLPANKILGQHLYFHSQLVNEEWRPIPGYESLYQISNLGRVKSIFKDGSSSIRALQTGAAGYLTIALSKQRKPKTYLIHRLVAASFCANPYNKKIVNHKDGNRQNNKFDNLEWTTIRENNIHGSQFKKKIPYSQGSKNIGAKLNEQQVVSIYQSTDSAKNLAKQFRVSETTIYFIKTKKTWKNVLYKIDPDVVYKE